MSEEDRRVEVATGSFSPRRLLERMGRSLRPYRGGFFLATAWIVLAELAALYPAWALGEMTNVLTGEVEGSRLRTFWILLAIWLALALGRYVLREMGLYRGFALARRAALDLKLESLRRLLEMDLEQFRRESTGQRLRRVDSGEEGMRRLIRMYFHQAIPAVVSIVGIVGILASFDGVLSLGLAAFCLSYYPLAYWLTSSALERVQLVHLHEEDVQGLAYETVSNVQTVKALNLIPRLGQHLELRIERLMDSVRRRIHAFRRRDLVLQEYAALCLVGGLAYVGHGILEGAFATGLLVTFYAYFQQVLKATAELSFVLNEALVQAVSVGRAAEILDSKPTVMTSGRPVPEGWQSLRIADLHFAYEDEPVLRGIDLTVRRGERIGLVGPSGAGKTTLVQLLLKQREGYTGEILLDDVPLREIDYAAYLERTAVVLQETEVFKLSLGMNLRLAASRRGEDPAVQEQRLHWALDTAHLAEVVAKLPKGLGTVVGERGARLSGGQRQRLGIARALFRDPEILFLDEATSQVDAHSEELIRSALHRALEGVTAIVIAHRLSTVKELDRILVMEEGKLVEEGTFDELLARRGAFYALWQAQKLEITPEE